LTYYNNSPTSNKYVLFYTAFFEELIELNDKEMRESIGGIATG